MTNEKRFLLDALGGFIREEKLNFDIELNAAELTRLARINSVSGILGYMLLQSPSDNTAQLAKSLKAECLSSLAVFARRAKKAEELSEKLSAAGIDHVLFKGYILRELYPMPELRSFNDIDILINPEDRKSCHLLMLEQGYSVKEDWEPIFSYYKDNELYEIHTEIMEIDVSDKADYRGFFSSAWEHTEKLGEHKYKLTDGLHFVYLIAHIAKHIRGSGAGIRMYLDIAAFVKTHGNSADWEYIETALNELKLRKLANMALTVCEKYFGIESPIELSEIEPEAFESFLDYTLDGGVFGHFGRDGGITALKNAGEESRTQTLLHRAFPSAESIERRYTYLQGRHWLLPIAWVHRVIKNRELMGKKLAEVKSIVNTDEAEVEKLRRIQEEIGL